MLKQPTLGLVASALVIAVSLGFVSLFPVAKFLGSVSYALICLIPMEVVIGVMWRCRQPAFAARHNQPLKGILLALFTAVTGAAVGVAYFFIAGQGLRPVSPPLMVCSILSVAVMFWAAIIFGGWPFTTLLKNPIEAGFAMLLACYAVNLALFRTFFNYDFMRDAPQYVDWIYPHGYFHADYALVFAITALSFLFLLLHFDLWPLSNFPGLMRQPVLGLVWTAICLALGGFAFYLGVFVMKMDPLHFLVVDPVPFIFGTIIVLNMLEGALFASLKQPLKGVLSAVTAAILGTALAMLYGTLAPWISGDLTPGPPAHEFERWLASALLAVTFPFLIFYAEFFGFWPLRRTISAGTASLARATAD